MTKNKDEKFLKTMYFEKNYENKTSFSMLNKIFIVVIIPV